MKNDEEVIGYISHFMAGEVGGWDIIVPDSDIFLILEEFPYLELYEKEWKMLESSGHFKCKQIKEMSEEHKNLFLVDSLNYYKDSYHEIRTKLENILED